MSFVDFKLAVNSKFNEIIDTSVDVFTVKVTGRELWEVYLNAFPVGTNSIHETRNEYDCNACKQFIRKAGGVVGVVDNKLVSIWDGYADLEYPFNIVAAELSKAVKASSIENIFRHFERNVGVDKNIKINEDGTTTTWNHFYQKLPSSLVHTITTPSIDSVLGSSKTYKQTLSRSLGELTLHSAETVLDLIGQGSLYRGSEFKDIISKFIVLKTKYDALDSSERNNWVWCTSRGAKYNFRNSAIGTLLIDLSADVELDVAVRKFESVMAPANYKRPTALFTKRMVEDAENTITELGYMESLPRCHATLDDITVNNVLYMDRPDTTVKVTSLFDELKDDIAVAPKSFSKIDEIGIEDFLKNVVPNAKSMSVLMEGRHINRMVNLVAPVNKDAKSLFSWDNGFSWSYRGSVTDGIKENVKNAGGGVDGVLRFSIQWNEFNDSRDDLDAHCYGPSGEHIFFSHKCGSTGGVLDVDIQHPSGVAVENITWANTSRMREGVYVFKVHNFARRGGSGGFSAELEFGGQVFSFAHPKPVRNNDYIEVVSVKYTKAGGFEVVQSMESTVQVREVCGVKTNTFVKLSALTLSPNYWDDQECNGNKHYMFFLDGCVTDEPVRGFYNEFLPNELRPHRKVFECLGSKMIVPDSDVQMAGLGFSDTVRNDLIVRVEGTFTRTLKIKF